MEYRPFIVHLGAGPAGIEARVIESPMGSGAAAPFENPFAPRELARIASLFETAAREPSPPAGDRHLAPAGAEPEPQRELEDAGRRLYRALLRGPVETLWNLSLGSLSGKSDTGLRLEVRIDPGNGALAELQGLPWELLRPPGRTGDFLCRHRRTTVVRHLELPRPRDTPPLPFPLRVLLVAPSPAGVAPLDLEREVRELESALAARPDVRLRRLERPTLDGLVRALDEEPVHALHFMGHGAFQAGTGRGSLILEAAGGGAAAVSGEALAAQLADFVPPLRMVFLNACRTAEASAGAPYAGVATALVEAGVPAVVAMQYPVSDTAAIAFGAEVYRLLAAAEPVDLAVAAGRKAVVRHRPGGSPEWATPALFLRVPDGRLFAAEAPAAAPAPGREEGRRGRLAAGLAGGVGLAAVVGGLVLWGGPGDAGGRAGEEEPPTAAAEVGEESDAASMKEVEVPGYSAREEAEEPRFVGGEEAEEPPPVEAGFFVSRGAEDRGAEEVAEPAPMSRGERAASTYPKLVLGEVAYVPEIQAQVLAELVVNLGREMVKVTVSLDGHDPQVLSGFLGTTLRFRFGGESLSVHLYSLDRDAGILQVRVARSTRRADRSW